MNSRQIRISFILAILALAFVAVTLIGFTRDRKETTGKESSTASTTEVLGRAHQARAKVAEPLAEAGDAPIKADLASDLPASEFEAINT